MTPIAPPIFRSADPPELPDPLAAAVMHSLARPVGAKLAWPLWRELGFGLLTFGVGALVWLPRRIWRFGQIEQQQLEHLARWLCDNSQHPEAAALHRRAEHLDAAARHVRGVNWLILLALVFYFVIALTRHGALRHLERIGWDATYGYQYLRHPSLLRTQLFWVWTAALSAGFAHCWWRVRQHGTAVRDWMHSFNEVARLDGIAPTRQPLPPQLGLVPAWVVGGLLLAILCGAYWALPLAVAGALHRRYVLRTSLRNRAALARTLRAMMLARRPDVGVPVPTYIQHRCSDELCRALMPEVAQFCPRCGRPVLIERTRRTA